MSDDTPVRGRHLLRVSRVILLAAVLAAPWLLAAIDEVTQQWLCIAVLAATVICLLAQLAGAPAGRLPTALAPLLLALVLGGIQLLPLPGGLLRLVSPRAAELHRELLPQVNSPDADLGTAVGLPAPRGWRVASLFPARSRYQLSLLVLAVTTFYLASQVFNSPAARCWLLGLVATNGAALAFFGLVQRLTWNGRFYWIGRSTNIDNAFATFVNRNNAGGYLNLTLAAAVGLAIWTFQRREGRDSGYRSSGGMLKHFAGLDSRTLASAGLCAVIMAAVFSTLSRGAGLALLGALAATMVAVAVTQRRGIAMGWLVAATVAGLGLVAWSGLASALQDRFGTLKETRQFVSDGRVPNWLDALHGVPDFWPSGSGLGTYAYVYQMYQQRLDWGWYFHAENQYLEALFEGGVPGLMIMLAAVALVGWASWQVLRRAQEGVMLALAVAGGFALASQALQAWVDFGLYIPANMLLMATLCGAVCGQAAERTDAERSPKSLVLPRAGYRIAVMLGGVLTVAMGLAAVELQGRAHAKAVCKAVTFSQTPAGATAAELRTAIAQLGPHAVRRPDDYRVQTRMAKLWTHLYRVTLLPSLRREATPDVDLDTLWERTSPMALHERIHAATRRGDAADIEHLRSDDSVREFLLPALRHELLARDALPVRAIAHLRIAPLCLLVSDPPDDLVHAERARLCDPSHPAMLFQIGKLLWQAGRTDEACNTWRHVLELDWDYHDRVLAFAETRLPASILANELLPAAPALLLELAETRFVADEYAETKGLLLARVAALLQSVDLPDAERYYWRGRLAAARQENLQAIKDFARAVEQRPDELQWRYELARLLFEHGQLAQAHKQASHCARERPDEEAYQRLLREIDTALRQDS